MKTLFLRLFLWFWLAIAVVGLVLIVSSPLFTRSRPRIENWEKETEALLHDIFHEIEWSLEHRGIDGVTQYVSQRKQERPYRFFIYNPKGNLLIGIDPPREVKDLAMRSLSATGNVTQRVGAIYMLACAAIDKDERPFAVVLTMERPPQLLDLLEPHILAPRLFVLLLVAGVLCFWLARYLTAPVGALRRAARQLTSGDLTARVGGSIHKRHDEIGELARDFDEMAGRVETVVGSQKRLVRDVSHELRSPLARMAVALELAKQRAGGEAASALDRIEKESERLNRLIGELLTLSHLEAGGEGERRERLDLASLLAEVVADVEFEAQAKGCSIVLQTAADLNVNGAESLLRSAFENVLRNAVRYTKTGSEITVRVNVDRSPEGRKVTVCIRDHGPGVGEEHLANLFEPFYRVEASRDRASGGTGLGLAITARAVKLHGGTVKATNAVDGGLEIVIVLPLLTN